MISGFLNVCKPKGITSHDAVDLVRRAARQREVGHAGSLDPIATGVLAMCLGGATKLSDVVMAGDKEYEFTLLLGERTDTDDVAGTLLEKRPVPEVVVASLEPVLDGFRGEVLQTPPAFSAKKVRGKKLYESARRGKAVDVPPVPIVVHALEVLRLELPRVVIRLRCSKGTYVRALCRDLGEALGCGGTMESLVRTACGPMRASGSTKLELLKTPEDVAAALSEPQAILRSVPWAVFNDRLAAMFRGGDAVKSATIVSSSGFSAGDVVVLKNQRGTVFGRAVALCDSDLASRSGATKVLGNVKAFDPVRGPISVPGNGT